MHKPYSVLVWMCAPLPQVDPLAPHPSGRELLEMYRALQFTEKDVLQVCSSGAWATLVPFQLAELHGLHCMHRS